MDKFVVDQAEGLRRLLANEGPRVIAVTGGAGAPGRTTAVVNLAAALTGLGKDVLVIDECVEGLSVAAMLGGVRGVDRSAAVMGGELPLAEAVNRHAPGFGVFAAPRGNDARYTSEQAGAVLHGSADFVLIDAQLDEDGALSPLAVNAHDVLVVTRLDPQAITVAYASIKRLHFAHAIAQFRVLANGVHGSEDAQPLLDNLTEVASRYLAVAVEGAGCVAADPHMPRAVELGRCIVDAFPSTTAARDFRRIADEVPHWPMRPALAALSARATAVADDALTPPPAGAFAGAFRAAGAPAAPDDSTVAADAEGEPAYPGWQTDAPDARRHTQHA